MRSALIFILVEILGFLECGINFQRPNGSGSKTRDEKKARQHKRNLIRCCGLQSCLDVVFKHHPNSTSMNIRSRSPSRSPSSILETLSTRSLVSMTSQNTRVEMSSPETTVFREDEVNSDTSLPMSTNEKDSGSSLDLPMTTLAEERISSESTQTISNSMIINKFSTQTSILVTEKTDYVTATTHSYTTIAVETSSTTSVSSTSTKLTTTTSASMTTTTTASSSTSTESVTTTSTSTTTRPTTTTNMIKPTNPTTQPARVVPTCATTCVADASYFKADGSLDDPDYHGFWRSACGKQFLFGKIAVNWEQNVAACCKLGMTPITLDSADLANCFQTFTDGSKWRFNSRYWTSAVRRQNTIFQWCKQGSGDVATNLWGSGQPTYTNTTDNCAQMVIDKRANTVRLDDRHCGAISAFACQAPFFKTAQDGLTTYLQYPEKFGTWVTTSKIFLFSFQNDTRTFNDAISACCSLGLKLISLHIDYKFQSVVDALQAGGVAPGQFWTSGTDQGCGGSFGYCTTNRLLRAEAKWKTGQPDNLNGKEHCVSVEVNNQSALLSDNDCNEPRRYICEGYPKGGVLAVEMECAAAFNLSTVEVRRLLVLPATTLREKCFIRCYGEATELFVNGKLAEDRIMAQFSSISNGDLNKLLDMYSTLNFCSNFTRGMDACDKAAKLMECGKVNSPEAFTGLMNGLENAFTEAPMMLPPERAICPVDYKCIVDDDKKALFDLSSNQSIFTAPDVQRGLVIHACGKKYLVMTLNGQYPMVQLMEMCCKYGLRLLTLETKEELDCFVATNPFNGATTGNFVTLAGSRMEYTSRPAWCFTRELVNLSWAIDSITPDSNPNNLYLNLAVMVPPRWTLWSNPMGSVACESL